MIFDRLQNAFSYSNINDISPILWGGGGGGGGLWGEVVNISIACFDGNLAIS